MSLQSGVSLLRLSAIALLLSGVSPPWAEAGIPSWMDNSIKKLETELLSKYGEEQHARLERGMAQVARFWRDEDGDAAVFEDFVRRNFAGDQETLDMVFNRFEQLFETLDGHMNEIIVAFRRQADLDFGPILPFDEAFAAYDPSAHISDDFFKNKLAFTILLNFPLTSLEQRLSEGESWSRRQWAEARLAQRFSKRIPAKVNLAVSEASARADQYIAEYNIWMHHLLDQKGRRIFPPKMRLLSHWNLRDEIKAQYSAKESVVVKQRMIQRVMETIVTQTIPEVVINNPHVDWNPYTNEVKPAAVKDSDSAPPPAMKISNAREPDTRYEVLLGTYHASRQVDAFSPTAPTLIERRFNENREIREFRVRTMFEKVLSSALLERVAKRIEMRLGRSLEPYDIWYNGFRPRGRYTEAQLDEIVSKRYPSAEAFRKDIPNLLIKLGFSSDRVQSLAANILVEPARGSGHAWGAQMRSAKTRLRTRVGKGGMDYKGFNIAVHEMGHNVEQTLSLNYIDHTLLQGVPNTAFTEALAFVFQGRDLALLGLDSADAESEALKIIDRFWSTAEIAAVALVDMGVWHWMYDHPDASAADLKEATIRISKDVWNEYYAPVIGTKDVVLLGIYSHMIHSFLYLPDYPIGYMIAFQVEEQMKKTGSVGLEVERVTVMGNVVPDLWMKNATGSAVGPEALLSAAEKALGVIGAD